ncbi:hypothetical protein GS399_16720 [Pedobacter sp. HMF7647]|uniref:Uncharacterized protein n=1 Tax=Hufsiella arboris TaxID=2695275 RepID=A0A7K1YF55_9SPHI|nr:hypothetical protein [Hufsiella arboris]MXV52619.1 hypothetical protein [Hufsiella arboris]
MEENQQKQERAYMLTGREGDVISLKTAAQWTRNYRDREPNDTISHFFGQEILNRILSQEECVGIRIYYAYEEPLNGFQRLMVIIGNFFSKTLGGTKGTKHLILAGADKTGTDQLPDADVVVETKALSMAQAQPLMAVAGSSSNNFVLGEQAMPCPGSAGCPTNALTR